MFYLQCLVFSDWGFLSAYMYGSISSASQVESYSSMLKPALPSEIQWHPINPDTPGRGPLSYREGYFLFVNLNMKLLNMINWPSSNPRPFKFRMVNLKLCFWQSQEAAHAQRCHCWNAQLHTSTLDLQALLEYTSFCIPVTVADECSKRSCHWWRECLLMP